MTAGCSIPASTRLVHHPGHPRDPLVPCRIRLPGASDVHGACSLASGSGAPDESAENVNDTSDFRRPPGGFTSRNHSNAVGVGRRPVRTAESVHATWMIGGRAR